MLIIDFLQSNFTFWVRAELQEFLHDSGTIFGPEVALGEHWALILWKGESDWPKYELDAPFWDDIPSKEEAKMSNRKNDIRRLTNPLLTHVLLNPDSPFDEARYAKVKPSRSAINTTNEKKQLNNKNDVPVRKNSQFISKRITKKFKILYEGLAMVRNNTIKQSAPLQFSVIIRPMQGE